MTLWVQFSLYSFFKTLDCQALCLKPAPRQADSPVERLGFWSLFENDVRLIHDSSITHLLFSSSCLFSPYPRPPITSAATAF